MSESADENEADDEAGAKTGSQARARKPPRPVTQAWLQRAALYYLERYSASSAQLQKVLARKVETRLRLRGEAEDPEIAMPARALIAGVVEQAVSGGYVDDAAYARARVASLRRRGGSHRAIMAKLRGKGLDPALIEEALAEDVAEAQAEGQANGEALDDDDADARARREYEAARAYARRRRLGPHRTPPQPERRDRDIAAMARAGFALALAIRVIDDTD
ncbi:regulatory protein RecX [Saliniramus sp.]|uniref:regulatory protein RecX n=1 Tax=Saliniramus sp. TaxID=2986772 RepID=UPI002CDFA4E4|nr:RecX family transcriptional regulator [Saliniramus sp.]HMB11454.1 RecX family transcriptional regulator [Saliniramus sp.]